MTGTDDLERWQRIEAEVDEHFETEGTADPEVTGGVDPFDRPLGVHLGDLLDSALERRGILGLEPGDEVGAYRLQEVLGSGGMGTVFSARRVDGHFEQEVALKILHRSPADEVARQRFLRERQILAGLRHPHIARLLDGGVVQGMPYLVMERLDGLPVTEYCEQHRLAPEPRLRLLLQACDAVRHAHRQGIIHRDLKPSNLLVEEGPGGLPKLVVLDFGIALLEESEVQVTATGQIFGTPGYMSPEQALGERRSVDRRSDVFSLGVVLYELLSGRRPFEGRDTAEVLARLREDEPVPLRRYLPGISKNLATIAETCLYREPDRRYDSVRALAADLESYLDGGPIHARPETLGERWWRRARRHPRMAAVAASAAGMVVFSLLLLGMMTIRHAQDLERERELAVEARREAEELLDFMLEDLHAGLEGVGRLDLLEQVARKSLDYYEKRPVAASAEEAHGRAIALRNAAYVLEEQGDVDAAIEVFEANRKVFADWAEQTSDPVWLQQLVQTHRSLAGAYSDKGEVKEALDQATQAVELSFQVGARELPKMEAWEKLHFESLAIQGWMFRENGLVDDALRRLEEALLFARGVAERDPENLAWRHRRAVALSYLGLVHQQEGGAEAALVRFESARVLIGDLLVHDPENSKYREELQLVLGRIAGVLYDLERLEETEKMLTEARHQSEVLLDWEPGNSKWVRELAVVHSTLASVKREQGDLASAQVELERSLAISRNLYQRFPTNHSAGSDLAWDLFDLGGLQQEQGDPEGARVLWEEAAEIIRRVRQESVESVYFLHLEVEILHALGRPEEARPLAMRLLSLGWKDPDFLQICEDFGFEVAGD